MQDCALFTPMVLGPWWTTDPHLMFCPTPLVVENPDYKTPVKNQEYLLEHCEHMDWQIFSVENTLNKL